jgi:hypothetical protein
MRQRKEAELSCSALQDNRHAGSQYYLSTAFVQHIRSAVLPRPAAKLRRPYIVIDAGWLAGSEPQSLKAWLGILHA